MTPAGPFRPDLPRYCSALPLPQRAHLPGVTRVKAEDGPWASCQALGLPPDRWREEVLYLFGADLYNHGFFWEAHEAWEAVWQAAGTRSARGPFFKGLIQCAAALLHLRRDKASTFLRVSGRAIGYLSQISDAFHMGLHLSGFIVQWQEFRVLDNPSLASFPLILLTDSPVLSPTENN